MGLIDSVPCRFFCRQGFFRLTDIRRFFLLRTLAAGGLACFAICLNRPGSSGRYSSLVTGGLAGTLRNLALALARTRAIGQPAARLVARRARFR